MNHSAIASQVMVAAREKKSRSLLRALLLYFEEEYRQRSGDLEVEAFLSRAGCVEVCQKLMALCSFPLVSRQELRDQWSLSLKQRGKSKTAPLCFDDVVEVICLPPGVDCIPVSVQDRQCILRLQRESGLHWTQGKFIHA